MGERSDLTLIYPVGPGDRNEPLRFSLRSIAQHLPEARVVLAGHRPRWAVGVEHILVRQPRRSWSNVARILRTVCSHPSTPGEFVLMNDDFFALAPEPPISLVYSGTLADLATQKGWSGGWYGQALANTQTLLRRSGHTTPLSYDRLHQPMPVHRDTLAMVLGQAGANPVLHRSLYGNTICGGVPSRDVKVRLRRAPLPEGAWASTAPGAWTGTAGEQIRARFPGVCRFELDQGRR